MMFNNKTVVISIMLLILSFSLSNLLRTYLGKTFHVDYFMHVENPFEIMYMKYGVLYMRKTE